ncbi:reverse transcriptase domain-containing protein [Tanacetum coccineum]|uniref:Reverse transcriptase domain-containing protein n=1 Tax=Tanacetum coccineum TaxID=301880 RepID=A0ABQ5FNG6_9ASTR
MPFGLKNAGATYQRLVDKAFDRRIDQNMEIYVDDLVIKSHTEIELLRDIEETFYMLQKINMKLTPKKCTFGATEGMFLGYMISPEGIKPCLDKMEAVLQLPSPRTIKEVQSLNGKLASLNRFLSKSAEKSLPLFKTLMTERDTIQTLVYFVSRALQAPELNYTPMEKLVLALVCAAKSVMLGEHNITYRPRTSVKGQILADFLLEKTNDAPPEESVIETLQEPLTLFTDGSSCVDGSGVELILTSPEGTEFTYALSFAHLSKQVLVKILKEKSIQEKEVAAVVEEEGPTWMTLIIEYFRDETLPDDQNEASKLRIKARQYELLEGILYRRSFLKP